MPDFDPKRLHDVPLNVSDIECECKIWYSRRNHRRGGLVTFRGLYRPGSSGTDDARLMRWRMEQFYELYHVDGVVIDCRELDYVWGDDLSFSVPDYAWFDDPNIPVLDGENRARSYTFPMLVVLRPEQVEAYSYALNAEERRNDLLGALAEIAEAIRLMKSRL